ncbi:hypothetical protein D6829_00410 [Candidatus Pacearchaeota archaeon]|nr:MAG: hypothetical protein D6829_00410 [Candidatus Pacearchaeota archaeon]
MVGFVLIVALVIVGLVVFLTISLRSVPKTKEDVSVEGMLESLMRATTECEISGQSTDFFEIFKSCVGNKSCSNLNENSCSYLKSNIPRVLFEMIKTEADISAYKITFLKEENSKKEVIFSNSSGKCVGHVLSGRDLRVFRNKNLIVELKICVG